MSLPSLQTIPTYHQKIDAYLTGFWAQDVWSMCDCPLEAADRASNLKIAFTCMSPRINMEIKYACRCKFEQGQWSTRSESLASRLTVIFRFLNKTASNISSLLARSIEYWETSLQTYLAEQGKLTPTKMRRPDAIQQIREYTCMDPRVSTLRQIYLTLMDAHDERPEYEKDIWDIRKLGISPSKSRSANKLNFTAIQQVWFREAAKKYIRYSLSTQPASTCQSKLLGISTFATFLAQQYPTIQSSRINRAVMIDFLAFLSSLALKEETRAIYLIHTRGFLELCIQEQWLDIPAARLILPADIPRGKETKPRFIPQDVLVQLNQHLDLLPPAFMRMILIIQECGMRIEELLTMPFNCLVQDSAGDWFLHYFQGKMKREHTIPISREVTAVIQEQQHIVRENNQQQYDLLFPNDKGQSFKYERFLHHLNMVAYEQDIRDVSGQLWHFESHQFRHTVGTRMINNGVPQPIIQRYLGHASPEMTNRYAFIHDQTMKEEFTKYRNKIVNIAGTLVEDTSYAATDDLQWMKKNILAQALPNGYCGLPLLAGPCPHANACLTCTHFRTDASFLSQHKDQLAATERVLATAQANNWRRQIEMNEQVKENLTKIIIALEPITNGA